MNEMKFNVDECEGMHMKKINSNFSKLVIGTQERNLFWEFLCSGTENKN